MILDTLQTITADTAPLLLQSVAESLFNDHILIVNDNKYRLLEIEFYIRTQNHDDPFTHGHKRQLSQKEWYCHASGLDITIGSDSLPGGILIRSIGKLKEIPDPDEPFKSVVIGPVKCLTEIFSSFGRIDARTHTFYLHDNKAEPLYDLTPKSEKDIIATPRIGLNQGTNAAFYDVPYRYLIYPKYGHKNKQQIAEEWYKQLGSNPAELPRIRKEMGSEFLKSYYSNADSK